MKKFRKTIEIKLNLGEINDLLMVYVPQVSLYKNDSNTPDECKDAMERLVRKLENADKKLKKKYRAK